LKIVHRLAQSLNSIRPHSDDPPFNVPAQAFYQLLKPSKPLGREEGQNIIRVLFSVFRVDEFT